MLLSCSVAAGMVLASGGSVAAGRVQVRVVNGTQLTELQYEQHWPFLVALVSSGASTNAAGQFCGGSLVAPRVVVTAAHCTFADENDTVPIHAADAVVVPGTATLSTTRGSGRIRVLDFKVHPGFNGTTLVNDVAVLKLASTPPAPAAEVPLIQASEHALWGADGTPANTTSGAAGAEVAGWGDLGENAGSYPTTAHWATINIADDATCAQNAAPGLGTDGVDTSTMLCAGIPNSAPQGQPTNGVDTCDGDSGGPLVMRDANGAHLVGITSWGDGCARNLYGAYTRVDALRSWVNTYLDQWQAPTAPGAVSVADTHVVGTPSRDDTIAVSWGAATDPGGSVTGYSYDFTRTPTLGVLPADVRTSTTEATSPALTDGSWYVRVAAVDNDGNVGDPRTLGPFVIDTTAPAVRFTRTPARVTSSRTASFVIAGDAATRTCALDARAAAPCASSAVYVHLGPGAHRITATARDAAGNARTIRFAWLVVARPAPPRSAQMTLLAHGRARLSWPVAPSSATAPVTGYVVRYGARVIRTSRTSITVPHGSGSRPRAFRVASVGPGGVSEYIRSVEVSPLAYRFVY
jgi:secreted trypsin-like serine protease